MAQVPLGSSRAENIEAKTTDTCDVLRCALSDEKFAGMAQLISQRVSR